jgi:hypothetical protein
MQIQPKYAPTTGAPSLGKNKRKKKREMARETLPSNDTVTLSPASKTEKKISSKVLKDIAGKTAGVATGQSVAAAAGPLAAQAIFAGLQTGFVKDYIDPQATLQQCRELAAKYPNLVELVELPLKSHGYDGKRTDLKGPAPLYYMRLGPKTEDRDKKLGIFQHASPHAREHVNPMTMVELAEQLCANYDPKSTDAAVVANTRLMEKLDIFISPQPNPDGANYSFYDDKSWRKNRAPFDSVDTGVDINRNYPYKWKGPDGPDYQTYPGKSAGSEPETKMLMEVVNKHPNIRFVLDWHSAAEEVRRPQGVSKADEAIYGEFHSRMTDAIASSRGRQYRSVVSNVVEGSSDDYWYHQRGIYSTVVEAARSFQPTKKEALEVVTECARGAREALEFAADFADTEAVTQRLQGGPAIPQPDQSPA